MRLTIMAAAGLALGLSACGAGDGVRDARAEAGDSRSQLRTLARLDCPRHEDDLRLTATSADGRTCSYRGDKGGEVELHLIALDGRTPADVLAPLEAELRGLVPGPVTGASTRWESTTEGDGKRDAQVRLPGVSVDADGERAHVRIAGLTIDADEGSARINVSDGDDKVLVNATDGRAEVRIQEGEGSDVRSRYILAQDEPAASGWRAVGYEVRGHKGGPLVLATVRTRGKHDDTFDEVEELLDEVAGR